MPLHILLFEFFLFYGKQLNSKFNGISIRQGGFLYLKGDEAFGKEARLDNKLNVESPLFTLDDVGSAARKYMDVRRHFSLAYDLLLTRGFN